MRKKHSPLEIALYCIGALILGIGIYFYFNPDTILGLRYRFLKPRLLHSSTFLVKVAHGKGADFNKLIDDTDKNLRTRISLLGLTIGKSNVSKGTATIEYTLNGIENDTIVQQVLRAQGKLRFYNTYDVSELFAALQKINDQLSNTNKPEPAKAEDLFGEMIIGDSTIKQAEAAPINEAPPIGLFTYLIPPADGSGKLIEGSCIGYTYGKDTALVMAYLNRPESIKLLPKDILLAWANTPFSSDLYQLHAVRVTGAGPIITEADVKDATQTFSEAGVPEVSVEFYSSALGRWSKATGEAAEGPTKKCIAILCDNAVMSAPWVQTRITTTRASITGVADLNEAIAMATILKAGPLPGTVQVKKQ